MFQVLGCFLLFHQSHNETKRLTNPSINLNLTLNLLLYYLRTILLCINKGDIEINKNLKSQTLLEFEIKATKATEGIISFVN